VAAARGLGHGHAERHHARARERHRVVAGAAADHPDARRAAGGHHHAEPAPVHLGHAPDEAGVVRGHRLRVQRVAACRHVLGRHPVVEDVVGRERAAGAQVPALAHVQALGGAGERGALEAGHVGGQVLDDARALGQPTRDAAGQRLGVERVDAVEQQGVDEHGAVGLEADVEAAQPHARLAGLVGSGHAAEVAPHHAVLGHGVVAAARPHALHEGAPVDPRDPQHQRVGHALLDPEGRPADVERDPGGRGQVGVAAAVDDVRGVDGEGPVVAGPSRRPAPRRPGSPRAPT
jgi:hypothetical protein